MSGFGATMRRRLSTAAGHLRLASAASLPAFLLTGALSTFNLSLVINGLFAGNAWWNLAVIISGNLMVFVPLWILSRSWRPAQRYLPVVIMSTTALAVIARTLFLASMLRPEPADMHAVDWIILTIGFVLLVAGVTVLIDSLRQEVVRVNRIDGLREAITRTRSETAAALHEERVKTLHDVTEAVVASIEHLDEIPREQAVTDLREVTHSVVRPVSHQLVAAMPDIAVPTVRVADYQVNLPALMTDATATGRLPVKGLAVVSLALPVLHSVIGSAGGLDVLRAFLGAVLTWVVGSILNRLLATRVAGLVPQWRAAALTCEMLVMAFVFALVAVLAFVPPEQRLRVVLTAPVAMVVSGWILLWSQSLAVRHERTAAEVATLETRLRWEVARANTRLRSQRRALARILHGPVQAALNAGAIRLDQSTGERATPELVATVQEGVRKALVDLMAGRYQERDIGLALERVRGTWQGLTEIVVHDPDDVVALLRQDQPCASAAIEIITEACSDAVRHGHARRLDITFDRAGDIVRIVVANDTAGADVEGLTADPGLGSAFLDAVAIKWERLVTPWGVTLTAEVPVSRNIEEPVAALMTTDAQPAGPASDLSPERSRAGSVNLPRP